MKIKTFLIGSLVCASTVLAITPPGSPEHVSFYVFSKKTVNEKFSGGGVRLSFDASSRRLTYTVSRRSHVKARLLNIQGRALAVFNEKVQYPGSHVIDLTSQKLPRRFLVEIQAGDAKVSQVLNLR